MRSGAIGQAELVLQLVERPGPGVVVGRPAQPMTGELLLGVAGHGLLQLAFAAPLRHPHRRLRSPQHRQPLLVEVGVVRFDRHEHGLGHAERLLLGVDALQHLGRPRRPRVRSSVRSRTNPCRPTTRPRRTKNTCTATSSSSPDSPITSMSSWRSATICWRSIALRTLMSRSRSRAARSYSRWSAASRISASSRRTIGVGVAVEEVEELLDQPVVGLLVDGVDARPRALLDVEQQARPAETVVAVELVVASRSATGNVRSRRSSVSRMA